MKKKLMIIALFVATAGLVALYPMYISTPANATTNPNTPLTHVQQSNKIEVVFALDTTGSMGGLITAAKEKIWSIASSMAAAQSAPEIKMGLVAYRDRGDEYVTRVYDLSSDLDSVYAKLMDFQAAGGGDGPESVNQALHDAVNKMSWSNANDVYKVVFLVGDAPPHMDYANEIQYPQIVKQAKQQGIVVNTIQCGTQSNTKISWMQMAQLANGQYFQVDQAGSAVAVATPYDKKLADMAKELDKTRVFYGSVEEKARAKKKEAATRKLHAAASVESQARRATFNVSKSGEKNFVGENELVEDITSGRVDLDKLSKDKLPAPMISMKPQEQREFLQRKKQHRDELRQEIQVLAKKRDDYIKQELERSGAGKASLDDKIYKAVTEQAASKGLHYDSETAKY